VDETRFLSNSTEDSIASAAEQLSAGYLVAFPTETVYGLGADACNSQAVARIYEAKARPSDHPLIVHIASMDHMDDWAYEVPEYAISLANSFWPGPMTLILKRSDLAADFITGGQDTVGVRVPDQIVALALLQAFEKKGGKGIAAPSANRFGNVSPTTAQATSDELAKYLVQGDKILDGGACQVGIESTIIDCSGDGPRILRPGPITAQMIATSTRLFLGNSSETQFEDSRIRVSGSLQSHYAPAAKVLLNRNPLAGQGFIAKTERQTPEGVIRLASPKSDQEFAQILYSALRQADAQGLAEVVVVEPLGDGLAIAIRDRLKRASNKE
jgi:L-threonylcarbamoyladenylate synthase